MLKNPLYVGQIRYKSELHQGQHEAIIAREHFDAVQAALAERAPGEEARIKRPASALLKGILFDGKGSRMQPTYSNKKGVRYNYYSSSKRLRSASDDPYGIRVPAGDLQRLVVSVVADRLNDGKRMQQWLAARTSPSDLPGLLKRCALLAALISSGHQTGSPKAAELIEKVVVSKKAVEVVISSTRLQREFGIDAPPPDHDMAGRDDVDSTSNHIETGRDGDSDALRVVITSHLLRCGKQVKLVLGHDPDVSRKSNPRLIEMIGRTRQWYEGLTSGLYPTLRAIAQEEQCDKSYVSRLLSVAFLAPAIVERILTGEHAASLTPERLRKACPLPLRWDEQRAMLLD
jgi:hypothetical protein